MTSARPSSSFPRTGRKARDIESGRLGGAQVLVVDNYDSFTQNVVHILAQLGVSVDVVRNDRIEVEAVVGYRAVVLSPGPGRPETAGICLDLVRHLGPRGISVLGVCLGHQAVAAACGGRIRHARLPLHGSAALVHHEGAGVLRGLPSPFTAARYHSLVVDERRPGRQIEVTARSDEGDVMALRHRRWPVEGVQFHPESYLTPDGPAIFATFLEAAGLRPRRPAAVVR